MLKFLKKTEQPVGLGLQSQGEDEENYSEKDSHEVEQQSNSREESADSSFSSINVLAPPPRKNRKTGPIARQNELIQKACSLLSSKPSSSSSVNPTALYWSRKLEKIHPTQRTFAEKAINDILFEAELGTLERDSVQINVSPYSRTGPASLTSPYSGNPTASPDSHISLSGSSTYVQIPSPSPPTHPPNINVVYTIHLRVCLQGPHYK
ncbi:unnamed protein product [Acanthoscelides obtectus]|uniref:Uncharacterized protein n=1 Tax=Acanthoscelides obtectus TaxID=200917 RepID=A0A9P0LUA2_ACAOB|nr:unnamed protein product [Acanthoscelides obtectus]CAK1624012.1 hypothetical protein AOBTE_LOCUS2279 [Acanthoscelides obtectus]